MDNNKLTKIPDAQETKELVKNEKALSDVETKYSDFNEIEDIITASSKGTVVCCN